MLSDAKILSRRCSDVADKGDTRHLTDSHFQTSLVVGHLGCRKSIALARSESKRKTRFGKPTELVFQVFAEHDFNFLKVGDHEIIQHFDGHSILGNASPLADGHSLLCPEIQHRHPQFLSEPWIRLAIRISSDASRRDDFRLGFNSLGAYASVNHLHFHILWLGNPLNIRSNGELGSRSSGRIFEDGVFPIERANSQPIRSFRGIHVGVTTNSHSRLIRLHAEIPSTDHIEEDMSAAVSEIVGRLQVENIPHNLIFCPNKVVFIFPRQFQRNIDPRATVRGEEGIHPAFMEAAGYIICLNRNTYDSLTSEDQLVTMFEEHVNLPHGEVVRIVNSALG